MQLDEYVAETIRQIVKGVEKVQEEVAEHNGATKNSAAISPSLATFSRNAESLATLGVLTQTRDGRLVQFVDFDIAVTVQDSISGGGGAKLAVGVLNIGGGGETSGTTGKENRVKFRVPIVLPASESLRSNGGSENHS